MILDLEGVVHSIWVLWANKLQECKGGFEILGSMAVHVIVFGWDQKYDGSRLGIYSWAYAVWREL